ncbi:MAG: MFS transporter, partial [Pseudorhodobacter sp.]|nr:MFS transporter [Frankiaceae bacterium]
LTVLALAAPLVACLGAAVTGAGTWVVAAAGMTGISASLSNFALAPAGPGHGPSRSIGTAFARAETGLQLAWVLGGAVAVAIPTRSGLGFGIAAALPALGVLLARQLALRSTR